MKNSPNCFAKAVDLLARRSHGTSELIEKLKKFYSEEEITPTIERLKELDFLNDQKYAEEYVRNRIVYKKKGIFMIKNELLKKRIPRDIIQAACADREDEEKISATEFLTKKLESLIRKTEDKQKIKLSLMRSGLSRGFASQLVQEIVQSLMKQ